MQTWLIHRNLSKSGIARGILCEHSFVLSDHLIDRLEFQIPLWVRYAICQCLLCESLTLHENLIDFVLQRETLITHLITVHWGVLYYTVTAFRPVPTLQRRIQRLKSVFDEDSWFGTFWSVYFWFFLDSCLWAVNLNEGLLTVSFRLVDYNFLELSDYGLCMYKNSLQSEPVLDMAYSANFDYFFWQILITGACVWTGLTAHFDSWSLCTKQGLPQFLYSTGACVWQGLPKAPPVWCDTGL